MTTIKTNEPPKTQINTLQNQLKWHHQLVITMAHQLESQLRYAAARKEVKDIAKLLSAVEVLRVSTPGR